MPDLFLRRLPGSTAGVMIAFLATSLGAMEIRVAINEVHYHPGDDSREGEFIELYNHGEAPADLSSWRLSGGVLMVFSEGTVLEPGEFLVVGQSRDALIFRYGLDPDVVQSNYFGSLENSGESLELWTAEDYLVSSVRYGDADPWPETPDGLGPSLERISEHFEDQDPRAWAASIVVGGTPGRRNSVYRPPPPSPGGEETLIPRADVWSYFRGTEAPPADWNAIDFDDSGWDRGQAGFGYGDRDDNTVLQDMRGSYATVFVRRSFQLADPSTIAELVLEVSYDDGFVAFLNGTEIARSNVADDAFDDLALASREAGIFEEFRVTDPGGLVAGANVLALQGHNSLVDSGDFSLSPALRAVVTEEDPGGAVEIESPPRDLCINELFTGGGADDGWVELYNPGSASVDASGRRLVFFPASLGEYVLPAGSIVPPRGLLLVTESTLGYGLEAGHALLLTTDDGRYIDALNPRAAPIGFSTGRFPDGADNRVVFRELSPGGPNPRPAVDGVVINEIMYHPAEGNSGGEYLELHNPTAAEVDLAGWSFTRGVEFSFAAGVTLPAGAYLVVARDPEALKGYYGLGAVHGPYAGRLRNDAETILLRDELGNVVDRVRFADEGSWPDAAPADEGAPSPTDGLGSSLELAHPALENRYGPAWRASAGEGTPGAVNSTLEDDPAPVVAGVRHDPVIPGPGDDVRVLASASDERPLRALSLFYDPVGAGGLVELPMADDGQLDDGVEGNGIYGARIPPHDAGTIVAFWITADAEGNQETTVPDGAPELAFLYRVEEPVGELDRPLSRVIMRPNDLDELRTRSTASNVLLDLTFVENGRAYYNRGIRLRGNGARNCDPRSYRIQFDHDVSLHGIKRLNLNGCNIHRQWIGLDFLARTSLATPEHWFRRIAFNGEIDDRLRLRVEAIDGQFLERNFPGDDSGNLYRGERLANLDYRGEDFDLYRQNYAKITNEALDDYSDVVEICRRFDPGETSDGDFPTALEAAVDTDQWSRYFAAFAILGSTENSILLNNGDDYYLYHRPSDGRWILLPWDLDSVFDEDDQILFRPQVAAIRRYLRHELYAPDYWCQLENLLHGSFPVDLTQARLEHLSRLFPDGLLAPLRDYPRARFYYIEPRIVPELTVRVTEPGGRICEGALLSSQDSLSLGGEAPTCGTRELVVGGEPANLDVLDGSWTAVADLRGIDTLSIVARHRDGTELARLELPLKPDTTPVYTQTPRDYTSDEVLSLDGSPYRLGNNTTVHPGVTLTIEAGVVVALDSDATLMIDGTLLAEGTPESPIVFRSDDCGELWEGIVFRSTSSGSRMIHCALEGFTRAEGQAAGLVVDGGEVELSALSVDPSAAIGLYVINDGFAEVSSIDWTEGSTGLRFDGGAGAVRDSVFADFTNAAILVVGASSRGVTVRDCRFLRCDRAIHAADGAAAEVDHLTIYRCGVGLRSDEGNRGSPSSLLAQSSIVWSSTREAFQVGLSSELVLSHSLTDGAAAPGEGNISADPGFADPAAGDLSLTFRSPCRGAGLGGSDMGSIPYLPGPTRHFIRSDANSDGSIDIGDAVFSLFYLFRGAVAPRCELALDANLDQAVDASDPVTVLEYVFLNGAPPPAPFPGCEEAPVEECAETTCPGA